MTGKPRGEFCTVGQMQDVTDVKVAAVLNAYFQPLRDRVSALEARAALPWWKRLLGRS